MIRWQFVSPILACPPIAEATEALPSLQVDLGETPVSSLSSGAYMAGSSMSRFPTA